MAIPETLLDLLEAPGPSGQEEPAAEVWRNAARGFGEVSSDVLGSSWVRVPGTGGPLLAVVGHIDEIGLVVTHIGTDGLLAVRGLGGFDPQPYRGPRVVIRTKDGPVDGVVGWRKQKRRRGDDRKPADFDDLFLDIGARTGDEAKEVVRAGDVALAAGSPVELRNGRIASRALDNRLGCYVALEVARRVAEAGNCAWDVAGAAVVQEEVGDFAGSRTVAYALEPAVVIAVDVTHATDVRGGDPEDEGENKVVGIDGHVVQVSLLATQQRDDAIDCVLHIHRRRRLLRAGEAAQHACAGRMLAPVMDLHAGNAAFGPDDAAGTQRRVEYGKVAGRHGLNVTTRRQAPPPDSWSAFMATRSGFGIGRARPPETKATCTCASTRRSSPRITF